MYSVLVEDNFGMSRDELATALKEDGVDSRTFFYPVHTQPAYSRLYSNETYPVAEDLSRKGINLPSGNTLTETEINDVVKSIVSAKEKVKK